MVAPDKAGALWDKLVAAGATPAGLGARDTLRLKVCYPLYGNDLSQSRSGAKVGPRLGVRARPPRSSSARRRLRAQREQGGHDRLVAFRVSGRGIPRQGMAIRPAGEVAGTMSPTLEVGIGMGYVPAGLAAEGTEIEIDVRGAARCRSRRGQAPVCEGEGHMSDEDYPAELHYHEAHDWVRVNSDTATFGITWYAQDTLGEVVFYSPPEVGADVTKDSDYGELKSTKAVSGLVAPLSGEVVEVNGALDGKRRHGQQQSLQQGLTNQGAITDP